MITLFLIGVSLACLVSMINLLVGIKLASKLARLEQHFLMLTIVLLHGLPESSIPPPDWFKGGKDGRNLRPVPDDD
jgi:hypothetical protein